MVWGQSLHRKDVLYEGFERGEWGSILQAFLETVQSIEGSTAESMESPEGAGIDPCGAGGGHGMWELRAREGQGHEGFEWRHWGWKQDFKNQTNPLTWDPEKFHLKVSQILPLSFQFWSIPKYSLAPGEYAQVHLSDYFGLFPKLVSPDSQACDSVLCVHACLAYRHMSFLCFCSVSNTSWPIQKLAFRRMVAVDMM